MTASYRTYIGYDDEANVWISEASTIPGLIATPSTDADEVVQSANDLAPVLLQENIYGRSNRPWSIYKGPEEVQHEIFVIDRSGQTRRATTSKINVLALT